MLLTTGDVLNAGNESGIGIWNTVFLSLLQIAFTTLLKASQRSEITFLRDRCVGKNGVRGISCVFDSLRGGKARAWAS